MHGCELDHKESWASKNWCCWTVVLEKTLESLLDYKEIKAINPKGNQSWISFEGLLLKLKLEYFGHLMQRADSLEKTLMPGKIEGKRSGGQRMRWLDGIIDSMDIQWTWVWARLGDGGRQGSLVCSPWSRKELYPTEWLNSTLKIVKLLPHITDFNLRNVTCFHQWNVEGGHNVLFISLDLKRRHVVYQFCIISI